MLSTVINLVQEQIPSMNA